MDWAGLKLWGSDRNNDPLTTDDVAGRPLLNDKSSEPPLFLWHLPASFVSWNENKQLMLSFPKKEILKQLC